MIANIFVHAQQIELKSIRLRSPIDENIFVPASSACWTEEVFEAFTLTGIRPELIACAILRLYCLVRAALSALEVRAAEVGHSLVDAAPSARYLC